MLTRMLIVIYRYNALHDLYAEHYNQATYTFKQLLYILIYFIQSLAKNNVTVDYEEMNESGNEISCS